MWGLAMSGVSVLVFSSVGVARPIMTFDDFHLPMSLPPKTYRRSGGPITGYCRGSCVFREDSNVTKKTGIRYLRMGSPHLLRSGKTFTPSTPSLSDSRVRSSVDQSPCRCCLSQNRRMTNEKDD